MTKEVISAAFTAIRRGGTLVLTAISAPGSNTIQLPGFDLTTMEKRIVGSVFGSGNPFEIIPKMLDLYRSGQLKLDELITTRYRLEDIARGYRDAEEGHILRGIIVHEH